MYSWAAPEPLWLAFALVMDSLAYDRSFERKLRIDSTLNRRQPGLVIVLENVHDPHNVGAILRSCDAVGVMHIMMVYNIEEPPHIKPTSSASGVVKWLTFERFNSLKACYDKLHDQGFQILATKIDSRSRSLYTFDLARPTAIVLGNEHRGISEEAAERADALLCIPMMGMAESLNVSVASAVCLFEAMRQRTVKGIYDEPQLSPAMLNELRAEWSKK